MDQPSVDTTEDKQQDDMAKRRSLMQAVMSPSLIDANYIIDSNSEDEDVPTSVGTASE